MLTRILLPVTPASARSALKRISPKQLCIDYQHGNYSSSSANKKDTNGLDEASSRGKAVFPGRFNNKVAIVTASSYG